MIITVPEQKIELTDGDIINLVASYVSENGQEDKMENRTYNTLVITILTYLKNIKSSDMKVDDMLRNIFDDIYKINTNDVVLSTIEGKLRVDVGEDDKATKEDLNESDSILKEDGALTT